MMFVFLYQSNYPSYCFLHHKIINSFSAKILKIHLCSTINTRIINPNFPGFSVVFIVVWRHSRSLMCRHRHSARRFAHFYSVLVGGYQVRSGDPFCLSLVGHSHFNPVLIYALDYSSVPFQRSRTDHDRLSDLKLIVLAGFSFVCSWLEVWFVGKLLHAFGSLS